MILKLNYNIWKRCYQIKQNMCPFMILNTITRDDMMNTEDADVSIAIATGFI